MSKTNKNRAFLGDIPTVAEMWHVNFENKYDQFIVSLFVTGSVKYFSQKCKYNENQCIVMPRKSKNTPTMLAKEKRLTLY